MSKQVFTITMPRNQLAKFRKWTEGLNDKLERDCYALLWKTSLDVSYRAKIFAPVDTGALRSSIRPKLVRDGKLLYTTVLANKRYAPYQEFGTRPRQVIPADAGLYGINPMDWFVSSPKKLTNVRPNPFLLPAVRISVKEMKAKLRLMGFKEK